MTFEAAILFRRRAVARGNHSGINEITCMASRCCKQTVSIVNDQSQCRACHEKPSQGIEISLIFLSHNPKLRIYALPFLLT